MERGKGKEGGSLVFLREIEASTGRLKVIREEEDEEEKQAPTDPPTRRRRRWKNESLKWPRRKQKEGIGWRVLFVWTVGYTGMPREAFRYFLLG